MLPQSYRAAIRARTSSPSFSSSFSPSVSRLTQTRFASQDYGSGDGAPEDQKPHKQGANPSADLEHPGPPPPDVGQTGQ